MRSVKEKASGVSLFLGSANIFDAARTHAQM